MAPKKDFRAAGTGRGRGGAPADSLLLGVLLTEQEAAERLNWSVKTLQRRRWLHQPPSFVKLGSSVRYPERSISDFINAGYRDMGDPEAA